MSRFSLHRFLSALVFIAAVAGWTSANAQFSNKPAAATGSVVNRPQVRAELIAHAPEWLRLLVERVRKLEAKAEVAE